jgi:hypothetical protein
MLWVVHAAGGGIAAAHQIVKELRRNVSAQSV